MLAFAFQHALFITAGLPLLFSCAVYRGQIFGVLVAVKRLKDGAVAWEARQYASETALVRVTRPFSAHTNGRRAQPPVIKGQPSEHLRPAGHL